MNVPVLPIAANTVRELVRSKLLYTLLLFAAALIAGSIFVAQLTLGGWERVIIDVSLAAIEIVGLLVAVLIGVSVVAGEVEKRTIYPTLAKPVSRGVFVLGRYLGLCAILALMSCAMVALLATTLRLSGFTLGAAGLSAALLILVEQLLMASIAVFFSSFTTPILASSFSLSLFLIGHLLSDLRAFGQRSESRAARLLAEGVFRLLPDLELLNLKAHAANALPVEPRFVAIAVAYGFAYAALLLALSVAVFSKRDLK